MSSKAIPTLPPAARVLLSLVLPILGSLVFSVVAAGADARTTNGLGGTALQLAGAGILCLFLGQYWYGLKGLGLRGGRPLYASIGFAVLAWLAFLVIFFATVQVSTYGSAGSVRAFVHVLLFEAFCVQLWAFGFFFRSVADWRGTLTATVASGVLFAMVAYLFFQESLLQQQALAANISGLLYFIVWGLFYGVVRLRTGSILGTTIVQAMHSWTAWQLLAPPSPPPATELGNLYLVSSLLYVLLIWRLWPKSEADYRV